VAPVKEFQARFLYAGGHPDHPKLPASVTSQVVVDADSLSFRRKGIWNNNWDVAFRVQGTEIIAVRQAQLVGGDSFGIGAAGNDQFVEVDINKGGRTHTIRFKAVGFTQQKDAFNLYSAVNALLGGSPHPGHSEPLANEVPQADPVIEKLQQLAALLERGVLTDEEFQQQKERILKETP
jgi:hypothetical protein